MRVRIIGIDTPEIGECATDEATAYMEQLVTGRALTFTDDPTQAMVDRFGRSLFYIDRDDGLDVGREMIRAGWAEAFVVGAEFLRYPDYLRAEDEAEASRAGVWGDCEGDFHRSRADEAREQREAAVAFTRNYYRRVSNGGLWPRGPCWRAACAAISVPSAAGRLATAARLGWRCSGLEHVSREAARW